MKENVVLKLKQKNLLFGGIILHLLVSFLYVSNLMLTN